MGQVKAGFDFQNISGDDLPGKITQFLRELMTQVNGGLQLKYNLRASSVLTFNFTTINQDVTVSHDLGAIPQGFLVVNPSAAMSVYKGNAPWSISNISLRSNAVGTAMLYAI